VKVCTLSELRPGTARQVDIDGRLVCVARTPAGQVHAIDDTCTHADISLSEGEVEEGTIECWLHGSRFDLTTGDPTGLPATRPVAVHHVTLDGDDVVVTLKENR
jgi:3-phenylpropionate/trans-cinnamate dioxygenase ferredoxin subunit